MRYRPYLKRIAQDMVEKIVGGKRNLRRRLKRLGDEYEGILVYLVNGLIIWTCLKDEDRVYMVCARPEKKATALHRGASVISREAFVEQKRQINAFLATIAFGQTGTWSIDHKRRVRAKRPL